MVPIGQVSLAVFRNVSDDGVFKLLQFEFCLTIFITMILTILLITFIIVLFFTVRRNFGKELKRQLNLITFVYFFFQLGYLFKFGVLLYCLISVRSVEDLEEHQTQTLLSLVPLIS